MPDNIEPDSAKAARIRSNLVSISLGMAKSAEGGRLSDKDVDRQVRALGVSGDPEQMLAAFEEVAGREVRDLDNSFLEFIRDEKTGEPARSGLEVPDFRRHQQAAQPAIASDGSFGPDDVIRAPAPSRIEPPEPSLDPSRFGPQTGFGSLTGQRDVARAPTKPIDEWTPVEIETEMYRRENGGSIEGLQEHLRRIGLVK